MFPCLHFQRKEENQWGTRPLKLHTYDCTHFLVMSKNIMNNYLILSMIYQYLCKGFDVDLMLLYFAVLFGFSLMFRTSLD